MKRFACPLLWLLALPASAQSFVDPVEDMDGGPATVFVSPFQPRNAAAAGLAGMMSSFLEMELSRNPDLSVIPFESVPPVYEMSAAVYLESCPPGQSVGCAFVVGSGAGAEYALTGTVLAEPAGTRVEVSIIDIGSSQEAMSFVAQLGIGEDERFASGVASVLVAVVRGEAGRVEDIRDMSEQQGPDYSAAAAQLEALSAEMGMVQTQSTRTGRTIEAPKMTVDDLTQRMQREGVKPWERVGLSPNDYMRWKNSGEPLDLFKQQNSGRRGQMILRPGLGFGVGPVNGRYNGAYVTDPRERTIEEVYAWQSQESGTGLIADFAVGYGLTPLLELGAQLGYASGRYAVLLDSVSKTDQVTAPPREEQYPNSNVFVGPYLMAGFLPDRGFRPVLGGSLLYWQGQNVASKEQFSEEALDTFSPPVLWVAQVRAGGELRVSKTVDFYAHIPITAVVGGQDTTIQHTGKGCRLDNGDRCLDTTAQPPGVSPVGAGFMVGLQVRLFGPRFSEN
jgi:TolB-like protein